MATALATGVAEEFRRFIQDLCGSAPDHVVADGRWHSFRMDDTRHKGSRPGRYLLHNDERPVGWVMDWRDEKVRHRWFGQGSGETLDRAEIARRRDARQMDRLRAFQDAADDALAFWRECKTISEVHPYLERKGVSAYGTRQGSGRRFGLGDAPCVIVPISDAEGKPLTLQAIRADGERRFWPGTTHEGGHFMVGKDDGTSPVVFCEGFSTAATLHEATKHPVVMAINTSNMIHVARWAGHRFAGREMIVAGDDDWHLVDHPKVQRNVGKEAAEAMAKALGGRVIMPDMAGLVTEGGDDFNDMAKEYGMADVTALFSAAAERADTEAPLPFEWFDEIDAQLEANWLVEDIIPSAGLCLVYGHPGSGKSFFALDMAMHIAKGDPWRERDVKQGLVVYIGAEGQRGLRQRIAAFRQHHEVKESPFVLIPVEVNLLAGDGDLSKVIKTVEIVARRYGLPVGMIVIDTLARTFGGGDEIGSDMVTYVNNVGRLQAAYNCTTMVIHHRPKDSANETPRGHGSLWGACDTIILVEDKGVVKQAKVTKQKDAEPAPPVLFELKVVELGLDEKGRPVTSCIVKASESQVMPDKRADSLSDGQRITFEQLCRTLADTGSDRGHDVPEKALTFGFETRVCRLSEWQSRTTAALADPDKSVDTISRTFRRYRDRLQSLGIIGVHGDWAWRIK
jgi:phage/plasmid primase-like uncharacterized protein/KaiC/GvpD/RAD55 family RecA-like ATPase